MNAAIDRTLTVPNFQRGQRHRASAGLTLAGGKGINIARALKRLGEIGEQLVEHRVQGVLITPVASEGTRLARKAADEYIDYGRYFNRPDRLSMIERGVAKP